MNAATPDTCARLDKFFEKNLPLISDLNKNTASRDERISPFPACGVG
jgi:hypothetical protein